MFFLLSLNLLRENKITIIFARPYFVPCSQTEPASEIWQSQDWQSGLETKQSRGEVILSFGVSELPSTRSSLRNAGY